MGDRGNIVVRHENGQRIYLYTHEYGSHIGYILASALKRAGMERWDCDCYLTRIIFCEMVRGEEMENIGFGIGTSVPDNDHPMLVVNVPRQRIYWALRETPHKPTSSVLSFREFILIRPAACAWLCPVDNIKAVGQYILSCLRSGMRFGSDIFCNRQHFCHSTIRYDILNDYEAHFYETRQLCDYAVDFLYQRKLVRLVTYMDPHCGLPIDYDLVLTDAGREAVMASFEDSAESTKLERIASTEAKIVEKNKNDLLF
ncbi:MAG: hypothetical protein PHR77_03335 [Kiritimatiellae bacterium]|nr:hypothetical protein [Kiritimatiellia bacterium]MDD5519590.1 hypothetical protein [Kiritimatiellia bacterium]